MKIQCMRMVKLENEEMKSIFPILKLGSSFRVGCHRFYQPQSQLTNLIFVTLHIIRMGLYHRLFHHSLHFTWQEPPLNSSVGINMKLKASENFTSIIENNCELGYFLVYQACTNILYKTSESPIHL